MTRSFEAIFHTARALPRDQREAFLKGACGPDQALRSKVDRLLEAESQAGSFLVEGNPLETVPATGRSNGAEPADRMIDRYKLLQKIGEGGFGSVWMAEQREPVERRVALKIIKLGMDTKQVIARFEAERQALAMMDHPNIARVFDAGATETGRPYFVMEYIRGVPILEYCDTEKLDTTARLGLFTMVCHAIQHAHQKGIIHRDIKPSNVLVTLHDGVPVPKVIDFGIAKATDRRLTEKTLFTEHRQMIGTPAYMSPEQAEMSGLDIDTRSDIYSLGVLLYELLTGTTPFAHEELMSRGFAEMMRIIREVEPQKPSTRLSTLGEAATRAAQQRHADDPKRLGLLLRGDLDWIVMKCLEKDRQRRYETANGLAADIRRHLMDEPVIAGPPSAGYRFRKFIRRNRAQVLTGGIVAAVLVLGVIGTSIGLIWALAERDRADTEAMRATNQATIATAAAESEAQARRESEENARLAIEEAERAERALREAEAVGAVIDNMFSAANPDAKKGVNFTVRELLGEFGRTIGTQLADQPLVEASIRRTVGIAYVGLGMPDDARVHLEKALALRTAELGADHPSTLDLRHRLLWVAHDQGQFAEAERLAGELLTEIDGRTGTDWLRIRTTTTRAHMLHHLGRAHEAEPMLRANLEASTRPLGEESETTLAAMGNLAAVCRDLGRRDEAIRLYEQKLGIEHRTLGAEHPDAQTTMHNLAMVLAQLGRTEEAARLYEQVLELRRRIVGEAHPDTLRTMQNLASCYDELGRSNDAIPLAESAVSGFERVFDLDHAETLSAKNNLGVCYMTSGRRDRAESLLMEVLETQRRVLGPGVYDTLGTAINLAHLAFLDGRYEDAIARYEPALSSLRRRFGLRYRYTRNALEGLAQTYLAMNRREEGIALFRELLEFSVAPAERAEATADDLNDAAWSLLTHQFEELRDASRALSLAGRACALAEEAGSEGLSAYLDTLALAQHRTGDTAAAVETQRRALALQDAGHPARAQCEQRLTEYEAVLRGTTDEP